MAAAPQFTSVATVYVKITPSVINANLIRYGTSMITRGQDQNLTFDLGSFSVDLNEDTFSAEVSDIVAPATGATAKRRASTDVSILHRDGNTCTIAASMVSTIFRTLRVH